MQYTYICTFLERIKNFPVLAVRRMRAKYYYFTERYLVLVATLVVISGGGNGDGCDGGLMRL